MTKSNATEPWYPIKGDGKSPDPIIFSPLLADIFTSMFADNQVTTTYLIDRLTAQLARAHARADAVEAGVCALLSGKYMPMPGAIIAALDPSDEEIAQFMPDES